MSDELPPLIVRFNEVIEEALPFRFITRSAEQQIVAIQKLYQFSLELRDEKSAAIESRDEEYANLILACESVLNGLAAEIQMCILLKEGDPDAAWDKLVEAQESCKFALRAHGGFGQLVNHIRRLDAVEHLLFPPQTFMSPGFVVLSYKCSVCEENYEGCEHIVRQPYMGKFCSIIVEEMKIDHVSIVDDPADRRARVMFVKVEGGLRNQMTWEIDPRPESDIDGNLRAKLLHFD